MFRSFSFYSKLEKLEARTNSARKVGSTECQKCGFCCWRAPGGISVEGAEKLAKHLNVSIEFLFNNYLTIHDLGKTTTTTEFLVIPIRKNQTHEAGRYLSNRGTFDIDTPCIFLDETTSLCKLHEEEAQPYECKGIACLGGEANEDDKGKYWTADQIMQVFDFDIIKSRNGYADFDDEYDF